MKQNNTIKDISKDFDANLEKFIKGEIGNLSLKIGPTPQFLTSLGYKPKDTLSVPAQLFFEELDEKQISKMKGFVEAFQNPVAVFNAQKDGDLRAILKIGEKDKPLYLGVGINKAYVHYPLTSVKELSDNPELKILRLISQGRAAYLDHAHIEALCHDEKLLNRLKGIENIDHLRSIVTDFKNPDEKVSFDIDDFMDQVGFESLPYKDKDAERVLGETLDNASDFGQDTYYPINKGTTGYFKGKTGEGKTVWTAFDNTNGDCFCEDFKTEKEARNYALNINPAAPNYHKDQDNQVVKSVSALISETDDLKARLDFAGIGVGTRFKIDHLCSDNDREIINIDYDRKKVTLREYNPSAYHDGKPFEWSIEGLLDEITFSQAYRWIRIDENRNDVVMNNLKQALTERVKDPSPHAALTENQMTAINHYTALYHGLDSAISGICLQIENMRPDFRKEGIDDTWIDDMKDEIKDLGKGIHREESQGISR